MISPETISEERPAPTFESTTLSAALSQIHVVPPSQAALTLALKENLEHLPPETMAEIAITTFVTSVLLGYFYEVDTLKKKGFSSNPITTLNYLKIDNPYLAAAIGNIVGQLFYFVSPLDMGFTTASLISKDGGHLIFSNLISRSIIGCAFVTTLNWAIQKGYAQPLIDKMRSTKEEIAYRLSNFDFTVFPPPSPLSNPYA